MPLTRNFKETLGAELRRDKAFRVAYLVEAIECLHSGEIDIGKELLRDFVNATMGFSALSKAVRTPPKSLMRMLSANGNPKCDRIFAILHALQDQEGVCVQLVPKPTKTQRRSARR